ncbi:MAG: hypothetical protein GY926_16110 [bacterium]|nr:hypothetical protein [bacterium]
MYRNLLNESSLYPILRKLDEELAAETKKLGCPCGGQLDRANYPRKPRGAAPEVERDPAYRQRLSFCCAEEGCRRRRTPASVLFLGRKVYLGAVVVVVSVLRQGPSPARLARLKKLVGVSARTVRRWHKWWLESFVESDFWKAARGRLRAPLEERELPRSLLEAFEANSALLQLVYLLRFVSPLTIPSPTTGLGF